MSKILFFVGLAVAIYLWLQARRATGSKRNRTGRTAASAESESMVSCAYCKLHIPLAESLVQDSRYYCCEEHRRLHQGHGGV